MINKQPHLALLSNDSKVVPKAERDAIQNLLRELLSGGVVSRSTFASQSKIDLRSLDLLLNEQENLLVHYDDHVCTEAYEKLLSEQSLDIITRMVSNIT